MDRLSPLYLGLQLVSGIIAMAAAQIPWEAQTCPSGTASCNNASKYFSFSSCTNTTSIVVTAAKGLMVQQSEVTAGVTIESGAATAGFVMLVDWSTMSGVTFAGDIVGGQITVTGTSQLTAAGPAIAAFGSLTNSTIVIEAVTMTACVVATLMGVWVDDFVQHLSDARTVKTGSEQT